MHEVKNMLDAKRWFNDRTNVGTEWVRWAVHAQECNEIVSE